MEGSCELVTRVLPLAQPKFQNSSQPDPWLVKPKIAFGSNKRNQALRHNVGKTHDAQKMNG
jgi:hypothetical protein